MLLFAAAVVVAELACPRQVRSSHLGLNQRVIWLLSVILLGMEEWVAALVTASSCHWLAKVERKRVWTQCSTLLSGAESYDSSLFLQQVMDGEQPVPRCDQAEDAKLLFLISILPEHRYLETISRIHRVGHASYLFQVECVQAANFCIGALGTHRQRSDGFVVDFAASPRDA